MFFTLVLAACAGGSGSSGFDITSENVAIQQALDTQHCVTRKTLTICPAEETLSPPTASPTPTGLPFRTPTGTTTTTPTGPAAPTTTPTPTAVPHVDIGVSPTSGAACVQGDSATCTLLVPFAPQGFPPSAQFRVAVRPDSSAPWTISAEPISRDGPNMENLAGAVDLSGVGQVPSSGVFVQLAILVFLHPPAVIPAAVTELADSGADYAFVTAELHVQPAP
jgi:hypothetical protein